jgi:hypothetical protein
MLFSRLINSIIAIVAVMVLQSCGHNQNDINNSGCLMENKTIAEVLKGYRTIKQSDTIKTKNLAVEFFNNPFDLDSTYHLALVLGNSYIVYDGGFNRYSFNIKVPLKYNLRKVEAMFILSKNGKSYTFANGEVCNLDEKDNLMQIVFMPNKSGDYIFYYVFTTRNKMEYPF